MLNDFAFVSYTCILFSFLCYTTKMSIDFMRIHRVLVIFFIYFIYFVYLHGNSEWKFERGANEWIAWRKFKASREYQNSSYKPYIKSVCSYWLITYNIWWLHGRSSINLWVLKTFWFMRGWENFCLFSYQGVLMSSTIMDNLNDVIAFYFLHTLFSVNVFQWALRRLKRSGSL